MAALALILQASLELTGLVMGPNGKPLAGATIQAGSAQVQTDARGRFKLQIPEGVTQARITAPGLEPQERQLRPGSPLFVRMEPKVPEAMVEVVEGSGYGSEGTPQSALNRIDIYTTPGAAADVFQAAKALPGVSNATEGAELFVRGGKPEEVGIFLNGGHLRHPFHHPSAQGGIFSAVDTAMVTSLNFIPGGFSARYGDALSAVLDLATDQPSPTQGGTAVFTLASQALQVEQPVGSGVLRGSARYSNTILLDRWFNLSRTFTEAPISGDLHVAYSGPMGPKGRISLLALGSRDHLGVETRVANLDDTYTGRSETGYFSALVTYMLTDTLVASLTLSRTLHDRSWQFGPWGIAQDERSTFHRAEFLWSPTVDLSVETGVDGEQVSLSPRGAVPFDLADWTPGRPGKSFGYDFSGTRQGLYATVKWRFDSAWGLSLGGRTDRYGLLDERTQDFRTTLSWQVSPKVVLRAAAGTFHQAPAMTELDPLVGNPHLKTLRAHHALVALDARDDRASIPWQVRLEIFRKTYDRLVAEPSPRRYEGIGHGQAQGVDLLLKARSGRMRGWLGYGYLHTRRLEERQLSLGPVPTSVPHNLNLVGVWTLRDGWEVSTAYRLASGAPFTPILSGLDDGQGGWLPQEGPRYSDRLPTYHRLDLRLTHLFTTGKLRWVAFLETMNLLNRRNLSGYSYSPDYQIRRDEPSYFSKRLVVGGLTLMW